ncbi:hypothetical protein V8E36_000457 [Tilletia maclaganii]
MPSNDDGRPPFDVPGHEWDPVKRRFFKKSAAEQAAAASTTADTRAHKYSLLSSQRPRNVNVAALEDDDAGASSSNGADLLRRRRLPAAAMSRAGGSVSHFQALQNMRSSGQHRSHLAQFSRLTSEQFVNGLRSNAAYFFPYLNTSYGTSHVQSICSAPDGTYWVGFPNNILLAEFASHPGPSQSAIAGAVYGPPTPHDDWKLNVKCTPSEQPTETLSGTIWKALDFALDDFDFATLKSVDRIDLVQGTLCTSLAPIRMIFEDDHCCTSERGDAHRGPKRWKQNLSKFAYDRPYADLHRSCLRIVPWLDNSDGRPTLVRGFACDKFVQILLSAPNVSQMMADGDVPVQILEKTLPPPFVMPASPSYIDLKWLVDFPALVVPSDPMAIEISADCNWLIVGLRNGSVLLWDLKAFILEFQGKQCGNNAHLPALNAERPGSLTTIMMEGRAVPRPPKLHPTEIVPKGRGRVHHIAMASETEFLVVFSSGDILLLRFGSLNEGPIRSFSSHPASLEPLGFTVHSKLRLFAAAGADGRVRIWSLDDPRPIEPHASEAGRIRITSREEFAKYGRSFFDTPESGRTGAGKGRDVDRKASEAEETIEAWWADTSSLTVMEDSDSFVAGKALHQIIFPSPPLTLAWVHRPIRDESELSTEEFDRADMNDSRIVEPAVPALAVGCHNVLWFFT